MKSVDDDEEKEVKEEDDESGEDSGLSLKWSSPNISAKEFWSMDFMGLIWLSERDSSSVGFSGNGFSKMCCRLLQAAMAEFPTQCSTGKETKKRVELFVVESRERKVKEKEIKDTRVA